MTNMDRAQMPSKFPAQCPACGVPVGGTTVRIVRTPGDAPALALEGCGHVITLEALRDVWGIEIPTPDPNRIGY